MTASFSKCVCGQPVERFEVDIDQESNTAGIVGIVNGQACCSAFTSQKYQALFDFQLLANEFNSRPTDLAIEAGNA